MDVSLFKFKDTLNRKYFIFSFLLLSCLSVTIHYLILFLFNSLEMGINYLIIKSFLALIYLALFMPFIIGRFKDAGVSPWWILIFWLATIFGLRNLILAQELWGIELNPFSIPMLVIDISSFILILVLLFKPGNHDKDKKIFKLLITDATYFSQRIETLYKYSTINILTILRRIFYYIQGA